MAPGRTLTIQDWIGFTGMVFGMFMAVLDIQIVASSIKDIQAGLSATDDEISWIQTSYLIAEVIMIPLSGWLARALSTKYLFVSACASFTLMSIGCAASWSLESMIFFRALQGFVSGGMIPAVFATIYTLFPAKQQPKMTVLVGLVVTVAPTAGPIIGGYLTEQISWHVLFLINVIPGIIVCIVTWLFIDIDRPEWDLLKKFNFKEVIAIALFLGSLQYVLEEGAKEEWFESTKIIMFSVCALIFGLIAFYHSLTYDDPMIDLAPFKNSNFTIGCIFSFIIGCGLFSAVFLLPVYLGTVNGLNSLQIGFYLMVTGIFQFISAPIAGVLADRIELRTMLTIGLFAFGLGTWMNAGLTHESGYWEFFWPQAVRGASLMFCFLPVNTIALGLLPVEQIKSASSIYNLMRNLGGAIGLAIINTRLYNFHVTYYEYLRESVTAVKDGVRRFQEYLGTNFSIHGISDPYTSSLKQLYLIAEREAYIIAFNEIFIVIASLFFISLLAMPFVKNVDQQAQDKIDVH